MAGSKRVEPDVLLVVGVASRALGEHVVARLNGEEPSPSAAETLGHYAETLGVNKSWLLEQADKSIKAAFGSLADVCEGLLKETQYNAAEDEVGLLALSILCLAVELERKFLATVLEECSDKNSVPSRDAIEGLVSLIRSGELLAFGREREVDAAS